MAALSSSNESAADTVTEASQGALPVESPAGSPQKRILLIDNYDSFTFNLVQYLGSLGISPLVWRNDQFALEDIASYQPDGIVISPGPCTPTEAGHSVEVIRRYGPSIPTLGVCLGHQSIGEAYGAKVVRAKRIMHGKVSQISHDGSGIFQGLAPQLAATRYHSLVVIDPPDCLQVNAWLEERPEGDQEPAEKVIMGLAHRDYPVWGVQFHPESILTESGLQLLQNFIDVC